MAKKLVLVVVDAMHPAMFLRAVAEDRAPTFAALLERGRLVEDCVSSFPSVTPVASSEMMTGTGPAGHWVIGMNWFHRVERRYIEYGSSFEATRTFGLFRAMYDLVYNMNLDHLSWEAETLFERLGDAGIRTATTPFLIYRGRRRHKLSLEGLVRMAAAAANFRHAVWAPDEFFYGDLYASRSTGCGPNFTRPGTRDEYSACVTEELVHDGAYDFLLFSLPDNDFHSHRFGPDAQVDSIAKADLSLARIIEAGGGLDAFLERHAVVLTSDHAQTPVEHGLDLAEELGEDWRVLQPNSDRPEDAEIAVSPTSRAGAVYLLDTGSGHAPTHERVRLRLREMDAVDLVAWLAGPDGAPLTRPGVGLSADGEVRAVVERNGFELRFRPGGPAARRPRRRLDGGGRARGAGGRHHPGPLRGRGVPRRPLAHVVGADLAPRRRRPDLGGRRLRMRRLGRRQPHRRRQPRLTRPRGFARTAAVRRLRAEEAG